MQDTDGWQRVMFSAECDPDGEGWCQIRNCDPAECLCIGPTQDGYEYQEFEGALYGRPGAVERLRKSLEAVLPFVGFVPLGAARERMNAAVSFALKTLEQTYKED